MAAAWGKGISGYWAALGAMQIADKTALILRNFFVFQGHRKSTTTSTGLGREPEGMKSEVGGSRGQQNRKNSGVPRLQNRLKGDEVEAKNRHWLMSQNTKKEPLRLKSSLLKSSKTTTPYYPLARGHAHHGLRQNDSVTLVGAAVGTSGEGIPKIDRATIFKSCDKPFTVSSRMWP